MVERDKNIVKHVQTHGIITIKQCYKIFFNENIDGYHHASVRLKTLMERGYLKMYQCRNSKEYIYYIDKSKQLSYHGVLALDYLAEIYSLGAKIIYFKRAYEWKRESDSSIWSDAFCIYNVDNKIYLDIVEVHRSCNELRIERYDELFETGVVQDSFYGQFPRVIIISQYNTRKKCKYAVTKRFNLKLDNFTNILL